jgi:hypothetical protein
LPVAVIAGNTEELGVPIELLCEKNDDQERNSYWRSSYAELNIAILEYKVGLAGGFRPSQNDVFAILSCTGGLIATMIEGKARENFDETLLN